MYIKDWCFLGYLSNFQHYRKWKTKSFVQNKVISSSNPYFPSLNELLGRECFFCGRGPEWPDTRSEKMDQNEEHGFGSPESWPQVLVLLWLWYLSKAVSWPGFSFFTCIVRDCRWSLGSWLGSSFVQAFLRAWIGILEASLSGFHFISIWLFYFQPWLCF